MKKIAVIFILALGFMGNVIAINQDTVTIELRNKAYQHYRLLKDTTTVRTWMNMDRLNKALIKVVEYDNQLLKPGRVPDSVLNPAVQNSPGNLESQKPEESLTKPPAIPEFDKDYLLAGLAGCAILVIILLVLLILRSISLNQIRRTLDEREETFNSRIKQMEFLEAEVRKMKSRDRELKADLENDTVDNPLKMQQLRLRIDELSAENTRLGELLEKSQEVTKAETSRAAAEANAIKQDVIDKLETMLERLKGVNM